jgi:hypothetical protein
MRRASWKFAKIICGCPYHLCKHEVIERALALSGERTKKAAVTKALKEFIARREQQRIVELFRNLDWEPGYDYKSDRSRR